MVPSRELPPLILLPPSEGKADGGTGPAWVPGSLLFPELDDHRARVVAALARAMVASPARRSSLLGVKGDALAAATEHDLAVTWAPTRPAIERYTGVLYQALDAPSLPAVLRRRVDAQVRIFSGLWGVVGPGDPIPDYKLKMGATLPRLSRPARRLAAWWRPALTAALAPDGQDRVVWDLLPGEHRAAWAPCVTAGDPDCVRALISVRFCDEVADGHGGHRLVTVSHWNKLLKGALVRHVLAHQLTEIDGLVEFDHPLGYRFAPDLTETLDDGIRLVVSFVKSAD
jgi:uncharacterized protein